MTSSRLQILVFCLLLAFARAAGNNTNATGGNGTSNSSTLSPNANFAPPPPITSEVLLVLNNSMADGKFIGSNKL